MEDQDNDLIFSHTKESHSEAGAKFEPLFIEEEDEDPFEDCLEDLEDSLKPDASGAYSQKCREAMHAEFNHLLEQMLTQLDDFEATHETKTTEPAFTSEMQGRIPGKVDMTGIPEADTEMLVSMAVDESQGAGLESALTMAIEQLGEAFEGCIEEVGHLERRRDELVKELLELEEPMKQDVHALRQELRDAKGLLSKARLERHGLQEEMGVAKRRLFHTARDCAQSQVALAAQQKEVDQLKLVQEELEAQADRLAAEVSQLRSDHAGRLQALQQSQRESANPGAGGQEAGPSRSYLSQGRRASMDLQQYLQGGLKALEEWYEPRLVALLKRRDGSTEALGKAREQSQELRARLGPLREETQRLELQRSCLEERIRLMEKQRQENVEQYRETVDTLEESSRELKTELQIQRRKTKEMEALKDSLMKELLFYRQESEGHDQGAASTEENT